jgi:hypothetical protein
LETIYRLLPGLHVTLVEFAKEFERSLRAKGGAGRPKQIEKNRAG